MPSRLYEQASFPACEPEPEGSAPAASEAEQNLFLDEAKMSYR